MIICNFLAKPKRFYKEVSVTSSNDKFEINLDGKRLKTPNGNVFYVNNEPLALAIANEWDNQKEFIIRSDMHLTTLTNTAIDNPMKLDKQTVVNEILNYIESDSICFRIHEVNELFELQVKKLDPIIKWFEQRFQCKIPTTNSVELSQISMDTKQTIQRHLNSFNDWSLLGVQFATQNLKSLILTLALTQKQITVDDAVSLSRIEEEFQAGKWGSIEWHHEVDSQILRTRVAAAMIFYFLNSEFVKSVKKSKF